jgi:hypothetical protein
MSTGNKLTTPISNIKDKAQREQLRGHFDRVPYPCLVDVKGRFYPSNPRSRRLPVGHSTPPIIR